MLKVMIVDDEVQIRKGLKMKLNWQQEGFSIVAEASDGNEALALLEQLDIDLVITDIRMPFMNGIDFFTQCHQDYTRIKIIVLSGYSDFEYAKAALKAGVKDYLLKPVAPRELIDVLGKIRKEIEIEKTEESESSRIHIEKKNLLLALQEQYLLQLVKEDWADLSAVMERLRQLQLFPLTQENIKIQFLTIEIRDTKHNETKLSELRLPFQMVCKEIAQLNKGYVFQHPNYSNMMHILIHSSDDSFRTKDIVQEIQLNVKKYLELETVIGIGNIVNGLADIKNGYISSLLAWRRSEAGSQTQVVEDEEHRAIIDFSAEMERKLVNALENIEFGEFKSSIHNILEKNKGYSISSFGFLANRIHLLISTIVWKYGMDNPKIQRDLWICQQSILELHSQLSVFDKLIALGHDVITEVQRIRLSDGSHFVEGVRRYIEKNYANDINLTLLSKQFHINGTYLSEVFKNHVGQTYSDYLINLRINKAKELLLDSGLKIIDVAQLVGFSNSGYFSTVFKKYLGQTPIEYRKENS
jgi:two-component system response regulator YesN